MNGLQTRIAPYISIRSFTQSASATAWLRDISNPYLAFVMDPSSLNAAATNLAGNAGLTLTNDFKVYLRQDKVSGFITNHSNIPVQIHRQAYKVRKAISTNDAGNMYALLATDAPGVGAPYVPLTLGNRAQRLLKFGKAKIMTIQPQQVKRYKLNTKFFSPKLITTDNEMSLYYLASKWTKGYMFKVIPTPTLGYNGSIITGGGPSSYLVSFTETSTTSMYFNGYENPAVLYQGLPLPAVGDGKARAFSDDVIVAVQTST